MRGDSVGRIRHKDTVSLFAFSPVRALARAMAASIGLLIGANSLAFLCSAGRITFFGFPESIDVATFYCVNNVAHTISYRYFAAL